MAAPSNPSINSSVKVNHSDGLKNVLLSNAAYGHQVFPRISSSEGLKIVLPAPAAPSSAFDGLVNTPSAAASTSTESSSGMEHPPYHVFINHYGNDTKCTIAKSIYKKLVGTGLRVFLDQDELRLGDLFPKVLQEAMASASLHIAILSENYARSPWCLAELAFILQLPNIIFIPIFYHVEPFTVRWARGNYADAFEEHERKGRFSLEKLQSWKSALNNASFYTGEKISNQRTSEEQLMAVQNDAAAASFNRPDTSVVQSLVPRNKRSLSPASGPNKRRKMIKVLGKMPRFLYIMELIKKHSISSENQKTI